MRLFLFISGLLPLFAAAADPGFVWHTPRSQYRFPEEAYVTRFVTREYLRWDGKALVPTGKAKKVMSCLLSVER